MKKADKQKMDRPKAGAAKTSLPQKEVATAKLDYNRYQAYIKAFRNPDPVLATTQLGREKGIELFADMKRDCHIAACLRRLTLTVTRYPFAIIPGGDSPQDVEAAEFLREQLRPRYYNLLAAVLDAIPVGFSVAEFWCDVGDRAEIAKLKKRRQERFTFDEFGNLLLKTQSSPNGEAIPQEGFIVATYQEEDNNFNGNGILSTCFWPWWFKKNALLFWSNYLERFNQPIAVGTFPSGSDDTKKDDFLTALESIQSDFALTVPEGWKVELVKAMDAGAAATFENFQAFMDRAISKAILGAAVNEGEQKFGSRQANETLKDISDEVIEAAAEFAAKVINETLIQRLCDWNFDLDTYPEFQILCKNKKLTKEEADVLTPLSEAGLAIPAEAIYAAQGWKIPEKDDLVMYKGKLIVYGDVAKANEKIAPISKLPATFAEPSSPAPPASDQIDDEVVADGRFIDNVWAGASPQLRAVYDEKQLLNILDNAGSYEAASKALIKHKPAGLEAAWRDVIELGHWLGEYSASRQMAGGQFAEPELIIEEAFKESFKKIRPKEAIAWLKLKIPVTKKVYEKLLLDAKNAAFYVSGLEDLELINAVREKMIRAMEKGIPFEQFRRDLKLASGVDPFFSNMKTAFYTNIHQAMAAQDYAALERVKNLLPYRRYSAVLDGATRPEHRKWHNFVARADDPIWNYLYSLLMDYNCRCRIVAATDTDFERLSPASAELRSSTNPPALKSNPTMANLDKLKELLKVKNEYAEFLDGKLGSWVKIMAKVGGK
jgi:phage gp29-like protein